MAVRIPQRLRPLVEAVRRPFAASGLTRRAFALPALVTAAAMALVATDFGARLEWDGTLRLAFAARARLGREPALDSRVKTFAYDDATVAATKAPGPTLAQWAAVIEALAARHPRAILFDKLFDLPGADEDLAGFAARVKATGVPVTVGAYSLPDAVAGRAPLAPAKWAWPADERAVPWAPDAPPHVYGPAEELHDAFAHVGHLMYDGHGAFAPVVRVGPDRLLPHLGLYAANAIDTCPDGLVLDGARVPLGADGRVYLNLATPELYRKSSFSMKALLARAANGRPIDVVSEGDVVVILPAAFSGHTDWVSSPAGLVPGGYLIMAMVDGVVSGRWLRVAGALPLFALGAALAGATLAAALPLPVYFLAGPAVAAAYAAGALLLFLVGGVVLPCLVPLAAFGLVGFALLGERSRLERLEQARVQLEMATAQLVQERFFPKPFVDPAGRMTVAAFHRPATECSGDWWQLTEVAEGRYLLLIGDAIGHGVSSALMTAAAHAAHSTLGILARRGDESLRSPAALLRVLNELFCHHLGAEQTMTMFAGLLLLDEGRLVYANAGHNFPLLVPEAADDPRTLKPSGKREPLVTLSRPGVPLGHDREAEFPEASLPLAPGDKLLLYTDGLLERHDPAGRQFGNKRLRATLLASAASGGRALIDTLIAAAEAHAQGTPYEDDVTVIVVELAAAAARAVKVPA